MAGEVPDAGPRLTVIGKLFIFLVIAGCLAGAYYLFTGKSGWGISGLGSGGQSASSGTNATNGTNGNNGGNGSTLVTPVTPVSGGPVVEIGIAYGTEKKQWFTSAVEDFKNSPEGAGIKVNLIPMGSLEGAQAIAKEDEDAKKINVWCPASELYTDQFVVAWTQKYGKSPILKVDQIALTPMVFVFWDERYQAFVQKYKTVSFDTINQALSEKQGWDGIAGKPDWGVFKFGHTHPNKSNSGLMTLVLMGYEYHGKTKDLALKDILDSGFQTRMNSVESATSGMIESTGTMMKDMVLKGPSSYDCLFVYESVVIDYLKSAQGRWGQLHIEYPKYNAWNDNPYYIIDAPWSSPAQRKAADTFLQFLLSEAQQKQSLVHGFRPGNPSIPTNLPDSPFTLYASSGLKNDLTTICDPPKAEVIQNLLLSWQRTQGGR